MSKTISNNHESGNSLEIAHSNQELITDKGLGRRKKIIMITGAAMVLIIAALVIASVILFTDSADAAPNRREKKSITLEDILEGRYNSKSFSGNGTWVSGNEILYKNEDGDILLYNVDTLNSTIILPASIPLLSTAVEFTLSPDHKFLLIAHDFRKLYRHSYVAQYTIVNLDTKGSSTLNAHGEIILQLAMWGPIGNALVFIARNNIFYRKSALSSTVQQITTDGLIGNVYNGVPDWVYEEEVFSSNKAMWFSPDGKKLAYGKFTDTFVKLMTLPVYGEPGSLDFQYTRAVQVRYPKPGTRNPLVSLHVSDLESNSPILDLEVPSNIINKEPILSTVAWANSKVVTAIWMNRVQNESSIVAYSTEEPYTSDVIKVLEQKGGWLELFKPPIFSNDGSEFILIMSQDQGHNAGSYRHVAILKNKKDSEIKPLTRGEYVVTEILGWDEKAQVVYYQATTPEDSSAQHVYGVSTSRNETKCLTCSLKKSYSNSKCTYNSAEFSKDFTNYIINCDGPGVPESIVFSKHRKAAVWEDNKAIDETLENNNLPIIKKLTFDVADGFTAKVFLRLPPNLDTTGNTKYPMLVNVYGGPDSYQAVDRFTIEWGSYLATNKSIIYATIDGRGSGLRGDKLLFSLYRRLGTVEIADQINVTKQIQETLPYVDGTRTAIWGWSYGGFASGMALATDTQGIFKCGISVAPVTDWALYDSIYTERFMGLPTENDNLAGYETAQLVSKYEGLRDKKYFLIHGTLDDNVHYQQSMLWAKVLEQRDILFSQLTYPDEDHGLASVRPHLYHSLEKFLDECFIEDE